MLPNIHPEPPLAQHEAITPPTNYPLDNSCAFALSLFCFSLLIAGVFFAQNSPSLDSTVKWMFSWVGGGWVVVDGDASGAAADDGIPPTHT